MKTHMMLAAVALVALLATGCGKDNKGRIHLFAEHMTTANSGAKVLFNPADLNAAQWVAGEQIDLDGTAYTIADDGNGGYCVNTGDAALPATLRALYPASVTDARGNDIETINHGGSDDTVLLHSLAVNFRTGGHDVYFPMAAKASSGDGDMTFRHITGGLKLTLHNNSGSALTLSSVKVVLTSDAEVTALEYSADGATVHTAWAAYGLTLPTGEIGEITGDVDISRTSEMNFYLYTDGSAGATIAADGDLSFCVPVTVSSLTAIAIVGFDASQGQRLVKSKALDSKAINRNIMYTIPTIELN